VANVKERAEPANGIEGQIPLKETEFVVEEHRLGNFLDLIGDGQATKGLGQALVETERRVDH